MKQYIKNTLGILTITLAASVAAAGEIEQFISETMEERRAQNAREAVNTEAKSEIQQIILPESKLSAKTKSLKSRSYRYDKAGRLVSVISEACPELNESYVYDKQGNILEKRVGNKTYTFKYDTANQLASMESAEGLREYVYDMAGRLIEEKLPQAQETNPASTTSNTTYKGFKSESEMLKDLKNHFPFIDTKKSYIRHSPYLNEDLNVQIQTVRNDYVKVSANYKSFKAQTAITIISAFLGGWATTQITVKILTVLGVGISTADLITTAVTLYKASEYNFFGAKYARVFDRLTHNAYVNVKRYTGKGKYAGGYNSAGEFHWVNSIVCEALNKNEATLATEAGTLYNNAVQQNGYCTYYPNSW